MYQCTALGPGRLKAGDIHMLALIKREIVDSVTFFLITAFYMLFVIGKLVYSIATGSSCGDWGVGVPGEMYDTFAKFPFCIFPLIAAAFGAGQMSFDRDKKISSFLATLATTRRQILSAKIITGILWLLLVILPLAAADAILLKVYPRIAVPDAGFLVHTFITIFLGGMACYSFGLLIGGRSGKLMPIVGIILVTALLLSLIVIKGISLPTMIFFTLFIIAALIRTYQKFMSVSL